MDKVTLAVKEMYEAYPYPSGTPAIRVANDVRLLLSYVQHARKHTGPLHVLDAGCGRGLGTLGNATLHADINFTGIDINSVGIKHAEKAARERRLTNVKFLQCDLMTLEGLRAPPGGYDVIYSSGVLHHLSDPVAGLKKLAAVLAPHGVISMMLYGRYGRQALYNLIESVDLLAGKSSAIGDKLAVARLLAAQADKTIFKHTYWQDTASVNEVEFVDRCLNVNETSYDIATLWELLAQADLKFVRWHEPADWSLATLVDNEQLRDELLTLSEFEQYQIVERLFSRPSLEFSLCKNMNVPRAEIDINNIGDEIFAINPDVSFFLESRNIWQAQRIESLHYKLRTRDQVRVPQGLLAQVLLLLINQSFPFDGNSMLQVCAEKGIGEAETRGTLQELLRLEILYRPHRSEALA